MNMMNLKKIIQILLIMLVMAGILTVLLAIILKGFDKLTDMANLSGLIFIIIGFFFIIVRSRIRSNDATWQSMQVRQHISQEDFYKTDVKDS